MPNTIQRYVLSQAADEDLESIFDFTEKEFGTAKAVEYLMGLESLFELIISDPQIGRLRTELKVGLRSITKVSHTIFYRVMNDHIRIVRVLHGSRDILQHL